MDYAFQDINDIPGELPAGRTKPWGTGQAVLAAKKVIDTPWMLVWRVEKNHEYIRYVTVFLFTRQLSYF